jgi:hypothetical protein
MEERMKILLKGFVLTPVPDSGAGGEWTTEVGWPGCIEVRGLTGMRHELMLHFPDPIDFDELHTVIRLKPSRHGERTEREEWWFFPPVQAKPMWRKWLFTWFSAVLLLWPQQWI